MLSQRTYAHDTTIWPVGTQGFEEACEQGREFGFDGKSLIHPKTVSTSFPPRTPRAAQ
jgi:hypothetical protein